MSKEIKTNVPQIINGFFHKEYFEEESSNKEKNTRTNKHPDKYIQMILKLIESIIHEKTKPWNYNSMSTYIQYMYLRAYNLENQNRPSDDFLLERKKKKKETYIIHTNYFKIMRTGLYKIENNKPVEVLLIGYGDGEGEDFIPLNDLGFYTKEEFRSILKSERLIHSKDINSLLEDIKHNLKKPVFYHKYDSFIEEIKSNYTDDSKLEKEFSELFRPINHYDTIYINSGNNKALEIKKKLIEKYKNKNPNEQNKLASSEYKRKRAEGVSSQELKELSECTLSGWNHIIIDGVDNLPIDFLAIVTGEYKLASNKYLNTETLNRIRIKIIDNKCIYDKIKNKIESAKIQSIEKAKTNSSIIAPYYRYTIKDDRISDNINYMLPLFLSPSKEKPDCVLIFYRDFKQGKYFGTTLLNMDEAYGNARLLGVAEQYTWLL